MSPLTAAAISFGTFLICMAPFGVLIGEYLRRKSWNWNNSSSSSPE